MSNSGNYKEPRLDKGSTRALVDATVGDKNSTCETGDYIVAKSRVISGAHNRVYQLFSILESMGINVDAERNAFAIPTMGFSPEIPNFGLRGEAIQVLTLQPDMPKKELVNATNEGLLRRGKPRPGPAPVEAQGGPTQ